jgi:hypothetical protein
MTKSMKKEQINFKNLKKKLIFISLLKLLFLNCYQQALAIQ